MKLSQVKKGFLIFILTAGTLSLNAQLINRDFTADLNNYSEFCAILFNSKTLIKPDSPDGPLVIDAGLVGKISLSTIDRSSGIMIPNLPIGFKVAIKNSRTNTRWMFSEKTYYELDIEELINECEYGDKIIIMTIERKYQLPRPEITFMIGC